MKCPVCKTVELKPSDLGEYGFVIIDTCPSCGGSWFDRGELDKLDDSTVVDAENLPFTSAPSDHGELPCPRCEKPLESISPEDAPSLVIDRCPEGHGYWLDQGELEQIQDLADNKEYITLENAGNHKKPPNWSIFKWWAYTVKDSFRIKRK